MVSSQVNSDPSLSADRPHHHPHSRLRKTLESVAFYGLLSVVIVAATDGDVDSSFQLLFVSLFFFLSAIRMAGCVLGAGFVFADRTLMAPLVGLILLAVFQILPLSASGILEAPPLARPYISINPYGTVNFVLLLGSLALLGDTLRHFTKTTERLKAIVAIVIAVGIGSALFGIYRQVFPGDTNLPLNELNAAEGSYAQFSNRNHFALLIEMTFGLLLGLVLKARLSPAVKISFWIMIGVCWSVIIFANSRGGMISAMGMILLAVFMHFLAGKGNESSGEAPGRPGARILKPVLIAGVLSTVLLGILTVSIAFIGGDTVVSRFENTNREFNPTADGGASRAEIWQATMRVIGAYPITGAGFGGFSYAITEFDTYSNGRQRVLQAHNEYLEVAASGAVAIILTAAFLLILLRKVYRSFAAGGQLERAISFGAVTGIAGVLLHSVVDFGLHVYINAIVFVLLIVLATRRQEDVEKELIELRQGTSLPTG
jgi:hypothetical protein